MPSVQTLDASWPAVPGLVLPYHTIDGVERRDTYRVRLLAEPVLPFGAVPAKPLRYLQPKNTPPAVYFPRCYNWREMANDPTQAFVVTEGELKAAACCFVAQTPCIGLGGVSSWRTAKLGWSLLPELEEFRWHGRDVVICFDSDATVNPDVASATAQLCRELRYRGAKCRVASLPAVPELSKTGLDDFLVHRGYDALQTVFGSAVGDELTAALWQLNERCVFVLDPGVVYDEVVDAKHEPGKFKTAIAAHRWAHEEVRAQDGSDEVKLKRVQVAPAWVEWPSRREAHRLTYAPGQERFLRGGEILNEWRGWGCPPVKGSVKPWRELLARLFDGEPREVVDWFERWCLYPIRFPGAKLFTACGIWSHHHGVGKTSVPVTLSRVYGVRNYQGITQTHLESDFNGWAALRQLVLVDDVDGHDSRSKASVMKSLVTQEDLLVNIKHLPQYSVPDVCNYVMTSNKVHAFYVEPEDRRWFVHEVTATPDQAFFDRYYAWIGDPKAVPTPTYPRGWREGEPWEAGWATGASALFHYALHELDFDGFDPHAPAPMTRSKAAMIEIVRNELDAWCAALARDPDAKLAGAQRPVCRDLFTARELAELFDETRRGPSVTAQYVTTIALTHFSLAAAGVRVKTDEDTEADLFFAVRNADRWRTARPDAVGKHVREGREAERGTAGGRF